MLNIFNLFLFLLLFWCTLMLFVSQFSWLYLSFGIFFCAITAFGSFKLKLIDKKSELLYLSFNFYRHFVKIYFANFFKSIKLIFRLAFGSKPIRPLIYKVAINFEDKFNPALMISSYDMHSGLLCVFVEDENFLIHALDEKYFTEFNLFKTLRVLPDINEDNLV